MAEPWLLNPRPHLPLGVAQLPQVAELRRGGVMGHPGLLCSQSSQPPVAGLGSRGPALRTAAVSSHHHSSHPLVFEQWCDLLKGTNRVTFITVSPAPSLAANRHTAPLLLCTTFLIKKKKQKNIWQICEYAAGNVQTVKWLSWKRTLSWEVPGELPKSGFFFFFSCLVLNFSLLSEMRRLAA